MPRGIAPTTRGVRNMNSTGVCQYSFKYAVCRWDLGTQSASRGGVPGRHQEIRAHVRQTGEAPTGFATILGGGWDVVSVDLDLKAAATVSADILTWDHRHHDHFDVIHASAPCTQYSRGLGERRQTSAQSPRDPSGGS